jgi:AcrR family transcriptional regulator
MPAPSTSTTPRQKRQRLDPDVRRASIIDAATVAFRQTDYSDVSIEAIADAAHVTRGLVHHYFGSKRALFLEVVERTVRVPPEARLLPEGFEGDRDAILAEGVSQWMRLIESSGGLWTSAVGGAVSHTDVDQIISSARDELVDRMLLELPLPEDANTQHMRVALRSYSGFARVCTDEWLVQKHLTREETHAALLAALKAVIDQVVPAMEQSTRSRTLAPATRSAG